ncbi:hypothetical protein K3495_g2960 [Podosphaera aphanis]|nr:hypothetical protein K3495_g2960 [Podosphaera aphanis]
MSSYWSTLVTTTTSRVASIRQNLLSGENDGDTEDDTHLCRVLRTYYTEKGRPFPGWLPPDPRAPPPAIAQPTYTQSTVGSKYGSIGIQPAATSSFASLFGGSSEPANPPPQDPPTLRQGRIQARLGQAPSNSGRQSSNDGGNYGAEAPQVQSRPLPSKMAGSYQTANTGLRGNRPAYTPPGTSSGQPMSAKDRLRAGNLRRPDPRTSNSSDAYSYSNSTSDKFEKPFVAATSPWANNETEFGGGGYEPPPRNKVIGLPKGPAAGKRVGLPSGPRGR